MEEFGVGLPNNFQIFITFKHYKLIDPIKKKNILMIRPNISRATLPAKSVTSEDAAVAEVAVPVVVEVVVLIT